MPNSPEHEQALSSQLRVQLHQVITAMHQQIAALDEAIKGIERTTAALGESGSLSQDFAAETKHSLQMARGKIVSSGSLLQWRVQGPPR